MTDAVVDRSVEWTDGKRYLWLLGLIPLVDFLAGLDRTNPPDAGMIVLALFPPLWRRVMDPRGVRRRRETCHGRGRCMSRYICLSCAYLYDEQAGDEHEGFPPGTAWSDVPEDWRCPDCGVRDKVDFEPAT